jgi:hypothetical protein
MKLALIIIIIVSVLSFVAYKATGPGSSGAGIPMPWQLTVLDQQHVEIFGLVLNRSTLGQAAERFGVLEDVAIYRNPEGRFSLEAYLGKVSFGPLSARMILNLKAEQGELEALAENVRKRSNTENGSAKWVLSDQQKQQQMQRPIRALTYIPDFSGMEEAMLRQQFGEPESRKAVDEHSELWFYPASGVRILVDKQGREVFEYSSPAEFAATLGENQ